jgi:branched-chain amino acid transport system permease protein
MNKQFLVGIPCAVLAVALTFFVSDFGLFQLATAATWAVAMLGLNMLTGYNGQISLGHGTFMGIGAYVVAILAGAHGINYPVAIACAAIVCFAAGVIIGIPALRLPGFSLALITVALTFSFPQLLEYFSSLTGGAAGLIIGPENQVTAPAWTGLSTSQFLYLIVVVVSAASFLIARNLVTGRWGLAMIAIRDNPLAADSLGVRSGSVKVTTFAISAAFAGLGGAMQAMLFGFVGLDAVSFTVSVALLTGVVIGGLGTTTGPLVGGVVAVWLPNFANNISQSAPGVVYGVLIIVVMLIAPSGAVGLLKRIFGGVRGRAGVRSGHSVSAKPETANSAERM